MAEQVRVRINGAWVILTKNGTTGLWEGTLSAPNITSFNVNAGHYYPVTVEATDKYGNVTTKDDTDGTLGNDLKLFVKEVTKPTITITAPSSGAFVITNTPAITVQLRDEANGSGVKISTLSLKIDSTTYTNTSPGMVVNSVSGGYDVTFTPQSALSDGSHTVTVNVQDNDGNAATQKTVTFTVDTVAPTLTVTSPADSVSYTNLASKTITGTTNDATSSPVTVTIKLNGVDQGTVTVNGDGSFSKAITLAFGSNTVLVTATDSAGKTTSVTRTIHLNTVTPVVNDITITPNPVNVGSSYNVSLNITMIG